MTFITSVKRFAFITDYRKLTTKYKETPKNRHKRTAQDEWERNNNKNFKSKKILKSEYSSAWPFYTDEIIIECRNNHWCIVTIEGYDYALNGSAKIVIKWIIPMMAVYQFQV